MGDSKKATKGAKMPKDVSKLTGDEVMRRVFGKKVAEGLKRAAHEKDDNEPETE